MWFLGAGEMHTLDPAGTALPVQWPASADEHRVLITTSGARRTRCIKIPMVASKWWPKKWWTAKTPVRVHKSSLCVCRTVKFKTNVRNFATVQKSMACTKSHLTKGMPPSTFTALHATHCRWMWLGGHWEDGAFLWILATLPVIALFLIKNEARVKGSNLAWEDVNYCMSGAKRCSLLQFCWVCGTSHPILSSG